jgi:hypothetical protein
VLDSIVGYHVENHQVHIHYYKPRGDSKEAWDNIDIVGFAGVPMQIKVNFLCQDSALAAPLVIDLVRLLDVAKRVGERGIQRSCRSSSSRPTSRRARRRCTTSSSRRSSSSTGSSALARRHARRRAAEPAASPGLTPTALEGARRADAVTAIALFGGTPVLSKDAHRVWPIVEDESARRRARARSGHPVGPFAPESMAFEPSSREFVGAKHCLLTHCGTSALVVALAAAGCARATR